MTTLRGQSPLVLICWGFEVSRSGDHAWTRRRPSKRSQKNARLGMAIQTTHEVFYARQRHLPNSVTVSSLRCEAAS